MNLKQAALGFFLVLLAPLLLMFCFGQLGSFTETWAAKEYTDEYQPGSLDHRTCEYNEFEGEVYSLCTTNYGLNSFVCLDDGICYSHCCIINQ